MRSAREKLAPLLRYGEPLATGALALWSAWQGGAMLLAGGAWPGAALMLALAAGAGLWSVAALVRLRVRAAAGHAGPGVVEAHEGRIAYFGPESGGVVALDLIERVSYRPGRPPAWPALWILESAEGTRLAIPAAAAGAERLPDHLGALEGFDAMAALAAIRRPGGEARLLWQRRRVPQARRIDLGI